jgi:hypothetical protein
MIFESFKKTIAIAKTHTIKPLDISWLYFLFQ